ncbi:MAG: hypothetical protein ACR2NP_13395 [Pirellulaceae bacterium]
MFAKLFSALLVVSFLAGTAYAQDQEAEVAWFDMANCEICQHMGEIEGLLQHVKWETHIIPNGMMMVSVVPESMKDEMEKAKQGMMQTISRIESGEQVQCCGFCQSLGALTNAGAVETQIESVAGEITMITSEDPALVEKIHAHAKHTIEAYKEMMANMPHEHSDR